MPTITIKNCSQAPVTNATIGNGSCYNVNQSTGEYVFGNCDSVKACAGQTKASVTVNDTSDIPASGGTRTFSVYYYGLSSASNATKSGSWSGTESIPASICPNTKTVSLTASQNTTTSTKTYTLTFSGTSASVTQKAGSAPVEYIDVTLVIDVNLTNEQPFSITATYGCSLELAGSWGCGTIATGEMEVQGGAGTVSDRLVWGPCTVTVGSGYPLGVSYVSCDQACNHDDVEIPAQTITIEAGKTEYNLGQANFRLCE